ncbi:solute carrier family 25 member 44a isoform X2 [Electrophorus electricus]|uniref:solute carrier family 25 member 44a isoform X2 n=1 Tax=Electrophorus electricus TaxID=8005 RepID=UPI0015D0156F|nr:solute carrier family 25 member 44a isoform X2 [Electrophorus electricus]
MKVAISWHDAAETEHPDHRMGGPGQEKVLLSRHVHDLDHACHRLPLHADPNSTAGGSASLVAQSITVPIDVVSQQLMMQGQGEHLARFKIKPKLAVATSKHKVTFGQTRDIMVQVFAADGFRGFYRGYVASLLTYIPNSAAWWPFYHFYAEQLSWLAPCSCPHLLLQAVAGPMAAASASVLTNPMDVVRARVQVEGRSSVIETFRQLLAEEGMWGLTKGLSARIISSAPTSILIVIGYETLKRLSLRPELVNTRHW